MWLLKTLIPSSSSRVAAPENVTTNTTAEQVLKSSNDEQQQFVIIPTSAAAENSNRRELSLSDFEFIEKEDEPCNGVEFVPTLESVPRVTAAPLSPVFMTHGNDDESENVTQVNTVVESPLTTGASSMPMVLSGANDQLQLRREVHRQHVAVKLERAHSRPPHPSKLALKERSERLLKPTRNPKALAMPLLAPDLGKRAREQRMAQQSNSSFRKYARKH
jgi:hypothetical protein